MDTVTTTTTWTDLSTWVSISTIAQGVVVILSVAFIIFQLRQNAHLARAANVQALTEQAAAFNAILYQDEKLCALWYSFGKSLEARPERDIDRLRYREMLVQWLIMHQNIYYQSRRKLLDKDIYDSWAGDLRATVRKHNLPLISQNLQAFFPGEFGRHIAALQKDVTGAEQTE